MRVTLRPEVDVRRLAIALCGVLALSACSGSSTPKTESSAPTASATSAADAQKAWTSYLAALRTHDLAAARRLTCKRFLDAGNDPSTFADQIAPPSGAGIAIEGGALTVSGSTARGRLTMTSSGAGNQTFTGTAVWQIEAGQWRICSLAR